MASPNAIFDEAYKKLNAAQKQAVDTVEGPVLVVAGPGTGKTHILTLRVANILRTTQANASNILALTFTDSAARTMRRRLATIIGEEATREVTITTFHSFCETILSRYPEKFPTHGSGRLMGDVEQVLLFREAIEQSDSNTLRPPKAPFTYLNDLKSLYDTLLREGMSLDDYRAWGNKERDNIRNDASMTYKRGDRVGDLTKKGEEALEKLSKINEAATILHTYESLKEDRGLLDFSDLLRLAIVGLANDETLRAELQEQYQYILADEHQDANALQHRLLELFAVRSVTNGKFELDDFPNIFVVGDEKQAIYRFQGADLAQFQTFTKMFPRATVVTLSSSFRSYQSVLDTAHGVIETTGTHTRLKAERGANQTSGTSLIVGNDPLDERAKLCKKIAELIETGVPAHEIAVISRKNDTADLIANQLEAYDVPVLRAGDVSLTSRPLVHALLAVMYYVADPTRFDQLRRALITPWWHSVAVDFSIPDILLFLRRTRDADLVQQLDETYPLIGQVLKKLIEQGTTQTPLECLSMIFAASGARDYMLSHADTLEDMVLIRHLMMYIEEASAVHIGATFAEAMDAFTRAGEHEMNPVKSTITEREGCVTVITAHKSKGMEFQYVFIPELTENGWEKAGKKTMIPSPFVDKQSLDDTRRLLYVAMTRAKDHAYLSYALENKDGRERMPSVLLPSKLSLEEIDSEIMPLLHRTIDAPAMLTQLVRDYLTHDGLAPTALNEYLESPAKFFVSRVLRIKDPPQGPAILGNAVHAGIATYLRAQEKTDSDIAIVIERAHADINRCFTMSLLPRGKVFDDLVAEAHLLLDMYITRSLPEGKPKHIEKGYKVERVVDGITVLLQGKIDAVFETAQGACIVDFKTGSNVSAKNEDYVRQLAMYTYLLEHNNESIARTSLIAISKQGMKEIPVSITKETSDTVLNEFDTVVRELLRGQWRQGQPSEYDSILTLLK